MSLVRAQSDPSKVKTLRLNESQGTDSGIEESEKLSRKKIRKENSKKKLEIEKTPPKR